MEKKAEKRLLLAIWPPSAEQLDIRWPSGAARQKYQSSAKAPHFTHHADHPEVLIELGSTRFGISVIVIL